MKKKRTIDDVVRVALCRELTKMEDAAIYGGDEPKRINNWASDSLASWVAPGVIKAVKRHLSTKKGKKP